MKWFLAKVVYEIVCGEGNHTAQFDEQLRLVNASDYATAFYKAKQIGIDEEDSFLNDVSKPVKWKFINVAEVYPLENLVDGVELYSTIHEEGDGEAYVRTIHLRAQLLEESASYQATALN